MVIFHQSSPSSRDSSHYYEKKIVNLNMFQIVILFFAHFFLLTGEAVIIHLLIAAPKTSLEGALKLGSFPYAPILSLTPALPQVLVCLALAAGAARGAIVPLKASLSHKDKLGLELPVKQRVGDSRVKVTFQSTSSSTTSTTTSTTTAAPEPQRPTGRPQYVDAAVFRHQFTAPLTTPPSSKASPAVEESSQDYRAAALAAATFSPDTTTASTTTTTTEEPPYDYEAHFRIWDDLSSFDGEVGALGSDVRSEAYIGGFRPFGF